MSEASHAATVRQIHSDLVDRLIQEACEKVRGFVKPAEEYKNPKLVIARYVAAVAVNFTDWIGKTYPWARHEVAQHALKDNLRCEQSQDHIEMLLNFAKQAGVTATAEDFDYVSGQVEAIRKLLGKVKDAGFIGLVILAVLENTSEVFIPVLEEMGKGLGVTDLTYTQVHGEADAEHSDAFVAALKSEWTMGYKDHEGLTCNAASVAVEFLRRIFEEVPTKKYPPILAGTKVRTTQPNMALRKEWTNEAWEKRKWEIQGTVVTHHDSHGLCYGVRHEDGTEGYYDPSELEIVP